MSIREEQCNKVCRILDDVLANRPTERDSLITAIRIAFSALNCSEFPNSSDTISRKAVIEALYSQREKSGNIWVRTAITNCVEAIEQLPPAQPERIKARWILAENQRPDDMENDNYLFICSNCGSTDLHSKRVPVPYCWNCGAKMEGEVTE